jgi:hypothetical protein
MREISIIPNRKRKAMRFQKKKITQEVRGILGKYLDGTEKEFREATERIVNIIQIQHAEKLVLKAERDNARIAADKSHLIYF